MDRSPDLNHVRPRCVIGAMLLAAGVCLGAPGAAGAADGELVQVRGTLTGIVVDRPDDRYSTGVLTVGTRRVSMPGMIYVDLPGDSMTLQELFARAPARCRDEGESGLLRADRCARPRRDLFAAAPGWSAESDRTPRTSLDPEPTDDLPETTARITAIRGPDGELVARAVTLTRDDRSVRGAVTFVSEDEGYLRIGGAYGTDEGGALVRLNDPAGHQSIQSGRGCGTEGNCSPDVRFKANTVIPTVRFRAGPLACLPGGLGAACAAETRGSRDLLGADVMRPVANGDHVTVVGGFAVVGGIRVLFAHTLTDDSVP